MPPLDPSVLAELNRRRQMMEELVRLGGPLRVAPSLVRELGMVAGQAGIYRDVQRTRGVGGYEHGVAVSLLPLGRLYPDDIDDEWLLYHYPVTRRAGGHDDGEVNSTKAARNLQLPLFVVTPSERAVHLRDVRWGQVLEWDDQQKTFLVRLGDGDREPQPPPQEEAVSVFNATRPSKTEIITRKERNPLFRYHVFKRYGDACAFCGVHQHGLVDAAHIVPVAGMGSDAALNGLPLCALHHRAYDLGLICIDPETTVLTPGPGLDALGAIRVERQDLRHLPAGPAMEALAWRRDQL